ncbi:MAG: ATP-binding cassette domain-containing protein [Bacteriovoracia bacterium]
MLKKVLFSNVSSIIKTGRQRPIELNDVPDLPELWDPDKYIQGFDELHGNGGGRKFILQVLTYLKPQAVKLLIMILVMLVFKMASPMLIHKLIGSIELASSGQITLADGIFTALFLCFVQLVSGVLGQHYVYHAVTSTQSAVNGINQRICKAILQGKNNHSRKGQVINRAGGDAELAGASLWAVGEIFQIILTMIATASLLFYFIGTAAILPLLLMMTLMPLSRFFSGRFARLQSQIMKYRDERVGKMNQFLEGIRIIKSFVWEKVVRTDISEIRKRETGIWTKLAKYKSISTASYLFASLSVSVVAFTVYILQGNTLTAAKAFTCLTLFSYLEPCFRQLPKILGEVSSSLVAGERIASLLSDVEKPHQEPQEGGSFLRFDNLSFDYPEQKHVLHDVNFEIEKGESVAVIGPVGSGKSSLLKLILEEVKPVSGSIIKMPARMAYVPQDPFLFHGSLEENIHMAHKEVSDKELEEALHASCLDHDLEYFPDGLSTEISEGGGNLSGGQKQRVNLARAASHRADLVLLDDPLSALDPTTEAEIIERLIFGHWKNKTRIVTTHRLSHLRRFDRIIFLEKGRILAQGNFDSLLLNPDFQQFIHDHQKEEQEEKKVNEKKVINFTKKTSENKSVEAEEQKTGEVALSLYWDYLKAMSDFSKKNLPKTLSLLLMSSFAAMLFPIIQNSWLSRWTQSLKGGNNDLFYLSIYALIGVFTLLICAFQHFYWARKAVVASEALHRKALEGVLSTTLRFFDANPTGRILNRFSRDLDAVEKDLSWSLEEAFMALLNSIGAVFVMIFALPFMGLVVLPVAGLYWGLQKSYRSCMREAKRLQSALRSPRISSIQELIDGGPVIRCYHAEDFFRKRFSKSLSDYQKAFYGVVLINRWFSIRIPLISSVLSLAASVGVILMGRYGGITEGIAGMAIVYAFRFWDSLNWTVRAFGEAEAQMTSVERLESLASLPPERDSGDLFEQTPILGNIEFEDVFARYAPHLPNVLKGATFSIPAGSKVGVVGRTGAGKSTLFSLLHRFIDTSEGSIKIDGKEISQYPLPALRESIGTIPQSPILFAGTIRDNLDPLNQHSTEELQRVLKTAHLDFLTDGLDSRVSDSGSNFSRGQRQLICLARALVRKSRIIIVDEATASVDGKTDALIRDILMNECPGITVLIIAHKLQSVSRCDMIIEMRDGKVLETTYPFSSPDLSVIPA